MNTPAKQPRLKPPRVSHPSIATYLRDAVPEKHRLATERALTGQMSRTNAIKQKCLQCCCYSIEEVRECRVYTCALNAIRPYQNNPTEQDGTEGDKEDAEIRI